MADTTAIYGWPYQEATDPPDGASLGQDLAEAIEATVDSIDDRVDTAETDITALETANTPVSVSGATVGSAATNFAVNDAVARTTHGGKIVYIRLDINSNNAITATAGNIADTTIFTVASAYRPTEFTNANFSANPGTGEAQLNADGTVVIRTADANIAINGDLRMAFMFIKS
jgi:hypothetical protein